MKSKMNGQMSRIATAALLFGLLLAATPSRAEETRTLTNLKGEQVTVPHVVPAREELALLKMVVVKIETPNGKGGLIVALYGTDESKRLEEANYVELYDLAGNLLEIAWLDESGHVKVAHDKNLTDPDAKEAAKALVMGVAGHSFVVQRPALYHF
ncbi:MAG: hypothetical protein HY278_08285 [candidate division NC10 bacterium]|nr:hypothetical protein [candidate division NC10 bacterium]